MKKLKLILILTVAVLSASAVLDGECLASCLYRTDSKDPTIYGHSSTLIQGSEIIDAGTAGALIPWKDTGIKFSGVFPQIAKFLPEIDRLTQMDIPLVNTRKSAEFMPSLSTYASSGVTLHKGLSLDTGISWKPAKGFAIDCGFEQGNVLSYGSAMSLFGNVHFQAGSVKVGYFYGRELSSGLGQSHTFLVTVYPVY